MKHGAAKGAAPEASSVKELTFKSAMCKLAAGVVVLTTTDAQGRKYGITMTAMISASLNPPLVAACIHSRSRVIPPLKAGRSFNINVLSARQRDIALRFAGPTADRFLGIDHEIDENRPPRISDASAVLECAFDGAMEVGDHTIVVGRVVDVLADAAARPLVYYQREFFEL